MATSSAIHHMLAILAGDPAPGRDGDAAVASLAHLASRLGWGALTPDPLETAGPGDATPWFVRVSFPGIAPTDAFIVSVATAAGLRVESLVQGPPSAPESLQDGATGRPGRWLLIGPQSTTDISSAVARLRTVHRIHAVPFRKIEDR